MQKLATEIEQVVGIRVTDSQIKALKRYEQLLLEWNEKFNLTAIREVEQIRSKHFLDSLTCFLAFGEKKPTSLIDVGTGAGFPGIVLKIMLPKLKLTLVESVGKKANFCEHVVQTLNLDNVVVVKERAEVVGQDPAHRENYDWAVARAVAQLPILAEYLLPLVKLGGHVLAQKGETALAETHKAERAIKLLGGHIHQVHSVCLPGVAEERYLVVIDKISATPPDFPRRVGIPSKSPLG
jgi:16S rRNA (guanine527-N7)-methyltransferase